MALLWPPNYSGELRRRMSIWQAAQNSPAFAAAAKGAYANDPVMFVHDCVWVYEPRAASQGDPTKLPAVPFQRQAEFLMWLKERFETKTSAPVEKSRDSGATWMASAFAVWVWLFHPGSMVGVGSRKEVLVDRAGDMGAIFPKMRAIIEHLPPFLIPVGWNPKAHSNYMRLINPENQAAIVGEAGDNIGRGGRSTLYFIDEAQPLDARVLTPTGWRRIGDMRVGDAVLGPDNSVRKVIGINDCGEQVIYRVRMSDGTVAECTENHLWSVDKVWGIRGTHVLRTKELIESGYVYRSPGGQTQYKYRVPLCQPLEFASDGMSLPLDPYLCGALLGDGSYSPAHSGVRITTSDEEIVEAFRNLLPESVRVGKQNGRYSWNLVAAGEGRGRLKGGAYPVNKMRALLDAAGLAHTTAPHKFIPDKYKYASPENRLALLQGLMDTDGYCSDFGGASFHTSSAILADDVQFVVRSLGGMCWHAIKCDPRGYRDQHCIQISLPDGVNPFRLERKATRYDLKRGRKLSRAIVEISPTDKRAARCISLDAPDGLYITDSFIVTHNSAFIERPALIEASLTANTDCRIDISSPRIGTIFNTWCATNPHKFIFDLYDCPWHDDAWIAQKKSDLESKGLMHIFRQEYLRDASAGIPGQLIPSEWVDAAVGAAQRLGLKVSGKRVAALDVADGGMDRNCLAMTHGIEVSYLKSRTDLLADGAGAWAYFEAMEQNCAELRYDSIGVGAGAAAALRDKRNIRVIGWAGSGEVVNANVKYEGNRTQGDMFANAKAQGWWLLRDRFLRTYQAVVQGKVGIDPDTIISLRPDLPELRELKSELSQVVYKHNPAGKIQIDKAPDGHPSPNRADSVMIAGAPRHQGLSIVGSL